MPIRLFRSEYAADRVPEDLCRSLVKFEAKSFAAAGSRLVVAATAAASGDMVLEAGPGFFLGDLALDGCVSESSVIFESCKL